MKAIRRQSVPHNISLLYTKFISHDSLLKHGACLLDSVYNCVRVHCMLLSFYQSTNQLSFNV
jgi:hypothetical protein